MKHGMIEPIRYRACQFFGALTARVSPDEIEEALGVLPQAARALFLRQSVKDQRHALAVHTTLRQQGHTSPHLLSAALLHDVGKVAASLPAWQRAVVVLVARLVPRAWARARQRKATGWHRPLVDYARHAEIGARLAREAGCSPSTTALIRHHEDRPERPGEAEQDRSLAALRAADSKN
jgi:hypothetical protein